VYGPNWSDPKRGVTGELRDATTDIRPRETRVIDGRLRTVFLDEDVAQQA
jgi:hypothetical protein